LYKFIENIKMITYVSLIIAIIPQFVGAIVALGLIKKTKYSLSWILMSVGFLLIAIQRFFEFIPYVWKEFEKDLSFINTWLGIVLSFLITAGVILIRQIFVYLRQVEKNRLETEKRILNAIIETEEKERRRFAKDLHDGLGPLLSTVKMAVSSLNLADQNPKNKEIVINTDLVITEAIRSLKEISDNISPHVLDNFGLATAIKIFASKINSTKAISISFSSNMENERLEYNTEVILYRVMCELLNNTIKHARAKNLTITLMRHKNHITLIYSDDGVGFDVNNVLQGQNEGMGYSNIMTRIKSIKGSINIESESEKGTKVIIIVNI
jgi:signal transduction histidine kinase